MTLVVKVLATVLVTVRQLASRGGFWYAHSKKPQRDGALRLARLSAPVSVHCDERGVPQIKAAKVAATRHPQSPAIQAQSACPDGINPFQASYPAPMEVDLIGILKRPFTLQDTVAVSGYLACSFTAAPKTEPFLTFIRDELGADCLRTSDPDWKPLGTPSKLLHQCIALTPLRKCWLAGTVQALGRL